MANLRDLREEIKEVQRDREFNLRCKISSSQYQILECVRAKNVDKLKSIINKGESPNFRTDSGDTLLHIVAAMGYSKAANEILRTLVYLDMPLDTADRFGQTPLHIAAERSLEMVKVLLEAGASVNLEDNAGRTALMHVCSCSSEEALPIVHCLLDRNANIFYQDQDGHTALHCLCLSRQKMAVKVEIAYKLLYAGLSATVPDKTGKMALCHELSSALKPRFKNPKAQQTTLLIRILVKAGSNFNPKSNQHKAFVKHVLNLYSDSYHLHILNEFEPVLSLTAVHKLLPIIPKDDENYQQLVKMLRRLSHGIQTLKFMCRNALRTELKGKVLIKVDYLPLPRTLKQYVLLEDES
ncbi:ankyrin repeat domain-containing protein 6-like [Saccostrea echinata]|uniref:ankyrin repeat domain-containing protein 6-like n=1 Tax=Saccostrea echinata TaxID=191078 RepID=UPI002A80BA6D|nr:ankyrin repeat domain-containing protein 6-like [Saccostrea echinata]